MSSTHRQRSCVRSSDLLSPCQPAALIFSQKSPRQTFLYGRTTVRPRARPAAYHMHVCLTVKDDKETR